MANFRTADSIEQILEKMNNSHGDTDVIHAGPCFLQYKLQETLLIEQEKRQKKLLDNQKEYNKRQLLWTRRLVIATWALVIVTALLAVNSKV